LIAEKPTVQTEIYLRNVIFAMFSHIHVHGKRTERQRGCRGVSAVLVQIRNNSFCDAQTWPAAARNRL
jgi:hypothetical protein